MIPASVPCEARYKHPATGAQNAYFSFKTVMAWDDDGRPLVVDERSSGAWLVPANTWGNFDGIREVNDVVGAVPGGRWLIEWGQPDGSKFVEPVVAWVVRRDGSCSAISTDGEGLTDELTHAQGFRLLHPATREVATETAPVSDQKDSHDD